MSLQLWSYAPRAGVYGSLDERARIVLALCGVAAAVVTWEPERLAVVCAAALALVVLSRVRWRELRRFALFAAFLITVLVTLTAWTRGGTPAEVRRLALAQALRMTAIVAFTAPLPSTLDPARYGVAIRGLLPSDRLAYAVELAFRFVPTFAQRLERTLEAQTARGLELSGERVGLVARVRRLVPVLIPVLLDSIVAGEDLADAMDLRAFGTRARTWSGARRFAHRDWLAVVAGFGLVAFALR